MFVLLWVFLIFPSGALCGSVTGDYEKKLTACLKEHIEENSLHPEGDVRFELLSRVTAPEKNIDNLTCQITSRPGEEYIGDTSFSARLFSNGVFLKEETLRVRIEVLRDFVFSLNPVTKNTVLTDDDVIVQKKWVRRIPANSLSSVDEVRGKSIAVSLRPHAQITRNILREVKTVSKGKMVKVVLDNGFMRIVMNGLAEEDGTDDSIIRVRNLNSNKIIYARVVGPSLVQIDF